MRSVVTGAAALLLALWVGTHLPQLASAADTLIRFTLTGCFALLILLRPKSEAVIKPPRISTVVVVGGFGAILHVGGVIFGVHQAEWIGLLGVVWACLAWSTAPHTAHDAAKALFLLYWAHPLPSQLLGGFQLTMQQLSVSGAEWLLHMLNVRVWADGLVLKTGLHIYEVPAWCSGMRTATTVFLLALGLGLIKRLALHQKLLVVAAALLQAIALNVIRISTMVLLVPRLNHGSSVTFLHDTAGIIVIGAVFLVYAEIELMRHTKRKVDHRAGELNPDMQIILREEPPFWRRVVDHPKKIVIALLVIVMTVLLGYKSRPAHRAAMYRGVTEALRDARQLADAERLGRQVQTLTPDDMAWEATILRLLVMRGKYQEVLDRIEIRPDAEGPQATENRILAAYSLMGLKRHDEARHLIGELPASVRDQDPRVAMILAEMAFYADDPHEVARRVVTAAQWGPNIRRIQALYPYLRLSREWHAIADTDPRDAYADPIQALSAAEAYMNLNLTVDVAKLARRAVDDWPRDVRLLTPLFFLAGNRPDEGWESHYAQHLRRCLPDMQDADTLYALVKNSFQLRRPDLAWSIYHRIEALDPRYPGLTMMAVRYGNDWFRFRRRFLGLPAGRAWDTMELRPYYHVGLLSPRWCTLCAEIPLGSTLSVSETVPVRQALLQSALDQFDARDRAGKLSLPMRYEYAFALEINKDVEGARGILDAIAAEQPGEALSARVELSSMYERMADWQNVYETLRTYPEVERPRLGPLLRLTTAQLNLRLGLGAIETARTTLQHYPESTQAAGALATALAQHDSPEDALHILSAKRLRRQRNMDIMEADALYRTQRYSEFKRFRKSALIGSGPLDGDLPQGYSLPPAELAINWHLIFVPTSKEFAAHAARLRENLSKTTSVFLRDLYTIWLAAYETEGPSPLWNAERWEACGRDAGERGIALNQLYIMLCSRSDFAAARDVAARATTVQPDVPLHWRFLIGLTAGDADVVRRAAQACPLDDEIWLAKLLSLCHEGLATPRAPPDRPELTVSVENVMARDSTPPATLTRGAELLLRAGYSHLAARMMRTVTDRARSLLPSYIVGLRCAILSGDKAWAERCALNAINASLQPPPELYRKLVQLKVDDNELDTDDAMVDALKNLRRSDPDNPLWPRMLSYVRFKRGGWEVLDSLSQAKAALEAGATDRMLFIVGAEAARLLHNVDRASDLLRQGLKYYPNDTVMLNNFAYTLADTPGHAAEALEFLPQLLTRAAREPWLVDTIALIYIRNDRLREAEQALGWLTIERQPNTPDWFRYRLKLAEIAFRRDQLEETRTIVREILRGSKGIPDEEILNANRLLSKADETLRQLGRKPEA